jgi:hypothetical protein
MMQPPKIRYRKELWRYVELMGEINGKLRQLEWMFEKEEHPILTERLREAAMSLNHRFDEILRELKQKYIIIEE